MWTLPVKKRTVSSVTMLPMLIASLIIYIFILHFTTLFGDAGAWWWDCYMGWVYMHGEGIWDNSSFHVKWRSAERVEFLFYREFLLVLVKFSFWGWGRTLGCSCMNCKIFLILLNLLNF